LHYGYNANEYWLKALDSEMTYYFSIEAINENGVGLEVRF